MEIGVIFGCAEVAGVANVEDTFVRAVPPVGVGIPVGSQAGRVLPDGTAIAPDVVPVQGDVHANLATADLVPETDDERVMQVATEHQRADEGVCLEEASSEEFLVLNRRDWPGKALTIFDKSSFVFCVGLSDCVRTKSESHL